MSLATQVAGGSLRLDPLLDHFVGTLHAPVPRPFWRSVF